MPYPGRRPLPLRRFNQIPTYVVRTDTPLIIFFEHFNCPDVGQKRVNCQHSLGHREGGWRWKKVRATLLKSIFEL